MVDTLKISLDETKISNSANLFVKQGDIEYSTGLISESDLFVTNEGEVIRGSRAYLNNEFYNITILPKLTVKSDYDLNKRIGYTTKFNISNLFINEKVNFRSNSRIYLQTSLPKINAAINSDNSYNLKPVDPESIPAIIKFINNDLNNNGINTNFDTSEISRVDLFNNIETTYNYKEYSQVFSNLDFSRKRNLNFGGETFLYYNKSSELCIYDKTKELSLKNIAAPDNTIRFEDRFLNKKSYFNKFKTKSLQSILNYSEYKKELIEIGNSIFKNDYVIPKIDRESLIKLFEVNQFNKKWFNAFIKNLGILYLLNYFDKNEFLEIIKDYVSKATFYRFRSEINKINFSDKILSNSKLNNLYSELKEKYFLKLAA